MSNSIYPYKQFALTIDPPSRIEGWRNIDIYGLFLCVPITVPVIHIKQYGHNIGFLIGWVADRKNLFENNQLISIDGISIETFREGLCGRFVLISRETEEQVTVTTDAGGLFPVVFDPGAKIVASSPAVISLFRALEFDGSIINSVKRIDSSLWYPFGLTPYVGLRRLLPSEVLSFGRGCCAILSARRPIVPEFTRITAKDICVQVAEYVACFSTDGKLTSHLTAGYDSRMVMAAILKSGIDAKFITISTKDSGAKIDVHVAKRLAKKIGVEHETIIYEEPSVDEISEWLGRVGYCINDAVVGLCRTVKNNDAGRFTLTGSCGEVGRSFYWVDSDIGLIGLDPSSLIKRLGFKESSLLISEAEHWLSKFSESEKRTYILDNAYIDLRLACWAGPSMPGHLIPRPTISPFNSVSVYRSMLALDESYRYSQRFATDFISAGSINLLSEDFNQVVGMARMFYLKNEIKKILPKSMKKKILQYIVR